MGLKDFGIPVVATVLPQVGVLMSLLGTLGKNARAHEATAARERLAFQFSRLQRLIDRVALRVDGTSEEVRRLLASPEGLELLGVARDRVATQKFEGRLDHFSCVLADHVAGRGRSLDESLCFAKAALDMPDEGILILEEFAGRAPGKAVGLSSLREIRERGGDPLAYVVAYGYLERVGFAVTSDTAWKDELEAMASETEGAKVATIPLWLSPLGRRFLENVHRRAHPQVLDVPRAN
jgi:hypothetical protein